MKKTFIFSLTALVAAWVFNACMKNLEIKEDPLGPGKNIYNYARAQQSCAMDGAGIAFRLNALLNEVRRQEAADPGTSVALNDVKCPYTNPTTLSLSKLFFGTGAKSASTEENNYDPAEITETPLGSGVYQIFYPEYYSNMRDNQRSGYVIIDTKGKLLNELQEGGWEDDSDDRECWEVRHDGSRKMQIVSRDNYYGNARYINVWYGDYRICRASETVYRVLIDDFSSQLADAQYEENPMWYASVSIAMKNMPTDGPYLNCSKILSENTNSIEMWGLGNGESMYYHYLDAGNNNYYVFPVSCKYQVDKDAPLVYKPGSGCDIRFYSGSEHATLYNTFDILESAYPYFDVRFEWSFNESSCSRSYTMYYGDMSGQ